jgi:hypothetical protein
MEIIYTVGNFSTPVEKGIRVYENHNDDCVYSIIKLIGKDTWKNEQ